MSNENPPFLDCFLATPLLSYSMQETFSFNDAKDKCSLLYLEGRTLVRHFPGVRGVEKVGLFRVGLAYGIVALCKRKAEQNLHTL